jgi:hypothetical protein
MPRDKPTLRCVCEGFSVEGFGLGYTIRKFDILKD